MSNRHESEPGYKETKVGWIPEDWDVNSLYEVAVVRTSNVDKKTYDNQSNVLLCNYMDVFHNEYITGEIKFMKATASNDESKNSDFIRMMFS